MTYTDTTAATPFTAEWDTQFKGLYLPLPLRCYSADGRYLLIRSLSGSHVVLYVYDFSDGKLIPLGSPLDQNVSVNGLAIFGHYVAVNVSDCRTPYRLYVFDLNTLNKTSNEQNAWHLIAEHQFKKEEKHRIQWTLDRFFPDQEQIPVESIYVHTDHPDAKRPLMVLVHGGPNSNIFCKSFRT